MADFKTLTFEQKGRIAEVTLNRPDSLNALNSEVMAEVAEVFETIDKTDSIAVSILTGAGRAFAAGADIKEMQPKSFNDMFELNFCKYSLTNVQNN